MRLACRPAVALLFTVFAGCTSGDLSTAPASSSIASSAPAPRLLGAASVTSTATVNGYRSNFTIARDASGTVTVTDTVGANGTQQFAGATLIRFADRHVSFDADGVPGQAYRVYRAALNRTPDQAGLGVQINALQNGMSLVQLANAFMESAEFKTLYGANPSNTTLVNLFYNNVLHRTPKQFEIDFWVNIIQSGQQSPAEVLKNFSESAENKANAATETSNGIEYVAVRQAGDPIVPKTSSYENKAAAGEALGPQALPAEVRRGNAVAFADFFQDGTYSMVTHSLAYDPQDPSTATQYGRIHFWRRVNGQWMDDTARLLTDTTGCLHPRKAVVADFNQSGRPSIFFACHGFDAPPFPGEQARLLLAQPDGTYKNILLPFSGFLHSAAAADIDGDGYPDVLLTGEATTGGPVILMNNRDGTFRLDASRLPASTKGQPIFTAEFFDVSGRGKYDVFLGGHEQSGTWPATILPNDGAGSFASTKAVILPGVPGYGFPTDAVFKDGNLYLARTIDDLSKFYGGAAIQKVNYATLSTATLHTHTGAYASRDVWINWIIPYNGTITPMNAAFGFSVPQ
ncbi:DUF4214 domain-containing protein [Oxalobacteraceae bacterium OM1]|nr:DUF4214 domain-containing protein [Oxalobacteraceae bacterium OM1]